MLWDLLPEGASPGGAPMNVAYHLNKLGISTALISRIGKDKRGKALKNLLQKWGLTSDFIQIDSLHETSTVRAQIDKKQDVSYDIVFPVAWDFIEIGEEEIHLVEQARYFVYGSLAVRSEPTRKALFRLLTHSNTNVLDINLRPPFYDEKILKELLSKTEILKLNASELEKIAQLYCSGREKETDRIKALKEQFAIKEIVVTKGAGGASYYPESGEFHQDSPGIEIKDTIGSGDAFLAAFLSAHAKQENPESILKKAVGMGAFIATKRGGSPEYKKVEYDHFLQRS